MSEKKSFSKKGLLENGCRFPIGGEGSGRHYKDVEPETIRMIILSEDE